MTEKLITSHDNPLWKDFRAALEPKGIRKLGLFVLSGRKIVREFCEHHPEQVAFIVASEEMDLRSLVPNSSPGSNTEVIRLGKSLFAELDLFGTKSPLLIGRVPEIAPWNPATPATEMELLCALGEPSNVGALLRSAAAFGLARVVLLKEAATPFHPKALRAAAGQTLKTPLAQGPSIQDLPSNTPIDLVTLDMHGKSLRTFQWPRRARLLIGQEGLGVPDGFSSTRVRIDMRADVESLNATVAASLAMFHYRLQHPI